MLYLLHTHWLWFFGALALGIIVGWVTYLPTASRWADRPVQIVLGVVAIGAIVAVAKVVPGRYGYWLELGVILAVVYTVGCFIGWALRDLADFMPAASKPGAAASAATTGSYFFRDTFAGMGAGTAYMRKPIADGGVARERLALGTGARTRAPGEAPAAGGYTFPKTLPFADATTSRHAEPAPGLRRHWSWPRPAGAADATPVVPEFTGSRGGYVFPIAAAVATFAGASRAGLTRAGQYKHWTWRGADAADTLAATAPAPADVTASSPAAPAKAALVAQVTPVVPAPAGTTSTAPIDAPAAESDAAGRIVLQAASSGAAPSPNTMTTGGIEATSAASGGPSNAMSNRGFQGHAPGSQAATPPVESAGGSSVGGAGMAGTTAVSGGVVGGDASSASEIPGSASPPSAPTSASSAGSPIQAPPVAATIPASATFTTGRPATPPSAPDQPARIAAVPGEENHAGERPEGLMTARDNRADDLKRIRGIGPQNEGRLHGLGIWHFDQIAAWTPDNVRWVGSYLAFPGRIDRETWLDQAKALAGGSDTEFSKRMRAGKVASSIDDGSQGQSNVADVTSQPRKPPR